MKYIKILGLLAVAAAALMAFAASASATTITSPTNSAYTGTLHATSENGHVILKNPVANIECSSTVHGLELTHGSGQTAKGAITTLTWGEKPGVYAGKCTNNWHVTTLTPGTLEIHWLENHVGTLTSSGAKVSTTRLGLVCTYTTNNTDIGQFTDSHTAGDTTVPVNETIESTATLHVNAKIPIVKAESSALCGEGEAEWKGSYIVNTPDKIYIDP